MGFATVPVSAAAGALVEEANMETDSAEVVVVVTHPPPMKSVFVTFVVVTASSVGVKKDTFLRLIGCGLPQVSGLALGDINF